MSLFQNLEQAVSALRRNVADFPIGAISIDDFKPTDEKIRDIRESLKRTNARLLILKTKHGAQLFKNVSKVDVRESQQKLQEATSTALLNEKAIKACLYSYATQEILWKREGNPQLEEKISTYMARLFNLNDGLMSLQQSIEQSFEKQIELKIQCQRALFDYQDFLKEQEQIRSRKLEETNPEIAKTKTRLEKSIRRINIMKKLITNFVAASGHMMKEDPSLVEYLEKHRDLITMETISKMSQTSAE